MTDALALFPENQSGFFERIMGVLTSRPLRPDSGGVEAKRKASQDQATPSVRYEVAPEIRPTATAFRSVLLKWSQGLITKTEAMRLLNLSAAGLVRAADRCDIALPEVRPSNDHDAGDDHGFSFRG